MRMRDYSRPTTLNPDRLFGQVAQRLAVAIITGAVKAGEVLPDEDDLRGDISVSSISEAFASGTFSISR